MANPTDKVPAGAAGGLADVLALGDELRDANRRIEESRVKDGVEPILTLAGASVELSVNVSTSAGGGLHIWVVNAEAGVAYERAGTVTV